jgi:predicted Zn-dependent protease
MSKHPKDLTFAVHHANEAMAGGKHEEAERRYASLLARFPNNALIANNLASIKLRLNRVDALEYAKKASELEPDSPVLLDTLAEALAARGRLDEALQVQRRALALAPEMPALRLHLARYLIKSGQTVAAKAELDRLSELGERFAEHAEVRRLRSSL